MAQVRYSPAQLARLLGVAEPTAEQAAVISAPLAPMAVIAGAGSGKSETMAARLVWLVANDLVRPERVLGLTFTRKAAAELAGRVRSRLDGLRRVGIGVARTGADGTRPAAPSPAASSPASDGTCPAAPSPAVSPVGVSPHAASSPHAALSRVAAPSPGVGHLLTADDLQGDPVIATYHSYAGRLVADHALREAMEPALRLITPAVAWQLAARVVAAYDGPMDAVGWTPGTVTAAVLDLAGELAEHLRAPQDVIEAGQWLERRYGEISGKAPALAKKILGCQRTREQLLPLVAAYRAAKAAREVIDYGDQMALAARIASRHPVVGAGERARY
jgi:DNA helicase II / ATP-dependent DNA helicase PcrA